MGVKATSKVWEWSQSVGNDRLVLLALADWADDDGYCWPGIKRLAQKCRISERTVQRSIRAMEKAGELVIEPGAGKQTQFGFTNRYRLVTVPTGCQNDRGCQKDAPRGDNSGMNGVSLLSPNPSVDPSEKPSTAFEAFWKAYPNKKAKGSARKAWDKIMRRHTTPGLSPALVDDIMEAIQRQKNSPLWLKENGAFIPHPATWLNGERWLDVVEVETKTVATRKVEPPVAKAA